MYRLTSASYSGGKSYDFTYNYYGNLTIAKENGVTVSSKTFNSYNRISSGGFTYDDWGNLKTEPGYQYVWNRQNYLTDIKDGVGTLLSSHLYNERVLRIRSSRLPAPSITVQSPNGGEYWETASSHDIGWTSAGTGDITSVDIEYSIDNGGNWINIVGSTENDGSYTWTVPDKESDQCLVRISDSDADSGASDVSDGVFSIVADDPPGCGGSWVEANYTDNDTFKG